MLSFMKKNIVPANIVFIFLFLASCGNPAEELVSSKKQEALAAAKWIIEASSPIRFAEKDIPFLLTALRSQDKTISYAAQLGLVNSQEFSINPLIGLVTNKAYHDDRQISNLMIALKLSDFIRDPILQLRARIQITSLFITLNPDYSWKIMTELNKHVASLQGEDALAMKSILLMELGSSYYSLKKKEGSDLIKQAFDLRQYLSKDEYRLDFVQAVSKIVYAVSGEEENGNRIAQIEGVISAMEGRVFADKANYYLAKGFLPYDPDQAYRYAMKIKKNIDSILELSGLFEDIDPKKADGLLNYAVGTARNTKEEFEKSKMLLSIAKYRLKEDLVSGIEFLRELFFNNDIYSELLSEIALDLVAKDPARSVFFVKMILDDQYKLGVIENVTALLLKLPTGFQNHLQTAFQMTNFTTNINAVLRKIALALAPFDPTNSYRFAKTGDISDITQFAEFQSAFAMNLSKDDIAGAKKILDTLVVPDASVSHFVFAKKMTAVFRNLSGIVSFDTLSYFQKITNLVDGLEWQARQTVMKAATIYLAKSHPDVSRDFLIMNNIDSDLVEMINELVRQDPLKLEKEALVMLGSNSISPLIGLITVPDKIHPQLDELLGILKSVSYKENIDRKKFTPLLLLLRSGNFPLQSMRTIVEIFSGLNDKNVIDLFVQFLKNPGLSLLHSAILDSLTQIQEKQVFDEYLDGLLQNITASDVPLATKINCVKMMGLSGNKNAGINLGGVFFGEDNKAGQNLLRNKELAYAVIETLGELGTDNVAGDIAKFLKDKTLYYPAALALGKMKKFELLSASLDNVYFPFAVTEAVSRFLPEQKNYKKLGYFAYTYLPLLNALELNGFDCYPVKSKDDAAQKGCDILLAGEYVKEQQGEPQEISGPDGSDQVYSEAHFLQMRLMKPGGDTIWDVTGYGYGAAWSSSVEDISKDPQAALTSEAEENVLKELKNNFRKKKDSLPFNF
ncbi:MAG: hypothetical protein A2Y33_04530 [Spirochaetes bacterium GWF1_51_8]|nr:MAG: hypothetical protein A2Y33_04530 [Spirochaetes bacterium GWF1_51_8]